MSVLSAVVGRVSQESFLPSLNRSLCDLLGEPLYRKSQGDYPILRIIQRLPFAFTSASSSSLVPKIPPASPESSGLSFSRCYSCILQVASPSAYLRISQFIFSRASSSLLPQQPSYSSCSPFPSSSSSSCLSSTHTLTQHSATTPDPTGTSPSSPPSSIKHEGAVRAVSSVLVGLRHPLPYQVSRLTPGSSGECTVVLSMESKLTALEEILYIEKVYKVDSRCVVLTRKDKTEDLFGHSGLGAYRKTVQVFEDFLSRALQRQRDIVKEKTKLIPPPPPRLCTGQVPILLSASTQRRWACLATSSRPGGQIRFNYLSPRSRRTPLRGSVYDVLLWSILYVAT